MHNKCWRHLTLSHHRVTGTARYQYGLNNHVKHVNVSMTTSVIGYVFGSLLAILNQQLGAGCRYPASACSHSTATTSTATSSNVFVPAALLDPVFESNTRRPEAACRKFQSRIVPAHTMVTSETSVVGTTAIQLLGVVTVLAAVYVVALTWLAHRSSFFAGAQVVVLLICAGVLVAPGDLHLQWRCVAQIYERASPPI